MKAERKLQRKKLKHSRKLFTGVLALSSSFLIASTAPSKAAIIIADFDTAYTEDFDTLASTGTSSTLPSSWAFTESLANANTTYTAGTGSGTAGDTYSFGAASSTERALGGLQSGTLNPTFGVSFENGTGDVITSLTISYVGEQWRLGALGRVDRLDFQYSTDATSLTTGTWIDVDDLDFTAPVTSGTVGALNGNADGNKTPISASITGLTIADGSTFWLRWLDFNATGSDDGLAIDDFSLTAPITPVPEPTTWALIIFGVLGGAWKLTNWLRSRSQVA